VTLVFSSCRKKKWKASGAIKSCCDISTTCKWAFGQQHQRDKICQSCDGSQALLFTTCDNVSLQAPFWLACLSLHALKQAGANINHLNVVAFILVEILPFVMLLFRADFSKSAKSVVIHAPSQPVLIQLLDDSCPCCLLGLVRFREPPDPRQKAATFPPRPRYFLDFDQFQSLSR
jgi:hypothetical protein